MPSWIQCPITHKLIPREEFLEHIDNKSALIQTDIEAFVSPVDGRVISGRADLRQHNLKHGVTDPRDYGQSWFEKKAKDRQQDLELSGKKHKAKRVDDLQRAFYQNGWG